MIDVFNLDVRKRDINDVAQSVSSYIVKNETNYAVHLCFLLEHRIQNKSPTRLDHLRLQKAPPAKRNESHKHDEIEKPSHDQYQLNVTTHDQCVSLFSFML